MVPTPQAHVRRNFNKNTHYSMDNYVRKDMTSCSRKQTRSSRHYFSGGPVGEEFQKCVNVAYELTLEVELCVKSECRIEMSNMIKKQTFFVRMILFSS